MDTEFCLGCDKQSYQGAYCSQACRLLDVEKGRRSATNSPIDLQSSSFSNTTTSSLSPTWSTKPNTKRFSLPPTFEFTPYTNKTAFSDTSATSTSGSESGYSSKRSSMASINLNIPYKSSPTGYIDLWKVDHSLSPEAQDQLHLYDSYFARPSKRSSYYKRFTTS